MRDARIKVLFVDDNARIQKSWTSAVRKAGSPIKTCTAHDLAEAARKLASERPRILVIDSCVPGDSPNTMNFITETKRKNPELFVLGVAPLEESRMLLLEAGADRVCCKSEVFQVLQEVNKQNKIW